MIDHQQTNTLSTKLNSRDGFLFWLMLTAAILFPTFSVGTIAALLGDIRDNERPIATLYAFGCIAASITSLASLIHSIKWIPRFSLAAAIPAIGAIILDPALRQAQAPAFVIITVPLIIAALSFGAYTKASRRRLAHLKNKIPGAEIHRNE